MTDILDLKGKVAIITGAGQGVGQQAALHFGAHNCGGVIVNDFHLDRAEAVAEEVRAAGGKALAIQADVTDLAAVKDMVSRAEAELGPVEILVNNAGNAGAAPTRETRAPFYEVGPEVWDHYIRVNLYGVINCTSAVVPGMIARGGGRIVTVISDAGRMGETGLEIYSGAKAGAAGFMRGVARSLGRHNIAANCVAIAATLTPAIEGRLRADPERLKKMMSNYVIRRPGRPDDVANMILYLSSDAAAWVTGQTYPVNGGFSFAL
ncbi:SDR family oxidoreductase [Phenylobacterium sp. SCN 70-31]|uniref:SDR family NAD(P)-dependent oxidoreductase n=1 Tax=Phenylobacterium sp. SCN 70-31 TaxID=1660129 RepID=UPI00086906AC|nr:SDR family oxidoreductase [Phenylobacterium sp. SCN 70-31]ODT87140.1 MAG: oxidoreductase [Phenylobacterium sp. SCN 70-31]